MYAFYNYWYEVYAILKREKKDKVSSTVNRDETSIFQSFILRKPNSTFAESFKILRTNVQFSLKLNEPKTMLITSSSAGEGKTTVTANLAISFANAGYKTITVDSDMRIPALYKEFNIDNSIGLSNYLNGDAAIKDIIQPVDIENLSMIPSGPIPFNSAELLSSKRMADLLAELKKTYQLIIVDSAPINVVADTQIISPLVDGTLIVISAGNTRRGDLRRAIDSMQYTNIIGLVLNVLSKRTDRYYYHYNYYKSSSYNKYYYKGTPENYKSDSDVSTKL
jgi:capsular exopolysaccharide synthesis family protein